MVNTAIWGGQIIAGKKVEKVVGMVPDKLEKQLKQKVKDSFGKSSGTKADIDLPDGKKDQKLLEDLRPEHEKIYPPRTDKAIQESKHVAKVMDKVLKSKKDVNRKVSVFTHEDGTVSVGISGNDGSPRTVRNAKVIEDHLNNEVGHKKYTVSGSSIPSGNIEKKIGGCDAGVCAEPKAAAAAKKNKSTITGMDTRHRGEGSNNHPYAGNNAETIPVDKNQMSPCATCAEPNNAKEVMKHANGKS